MACPANAVHHMSNMCESAQQCKKYHQLLQCCDDTPDDESGYVAAIDDGTFDTVDGRLYVCTVCFP